MKLFIRLLYFCLFCVFGVVFIAQTPIVKNSLKKRVIKLAKAHHIQLEIDNIEGSLPIDWTLRGVSLKWEKEDVEVSIEKLNFRFSILPFFRNQIEISHLQSFGGYIGDTSFEMNGQGRIDLKHNKGARISHFLIEGKDFFVRLEGNISKDFNVEEGHLAFYLPDLSLIGKKGSIMGMGQISKNTALFDIYSENLYLKDFPISNSAITLNATRNKTWWEGKANFSGGHALTPIEGDCSFRFTPSCQLLSIEELHAQGEAFNLFGKVDLDPSLKCVEGSMFAQCTDLKILRPFFPDSYIKGRIGTKIDFQSFSRFQDIKCQIEMEAFEAYDVTCQSLTVESTLYDLFGDLRGEFTIEGDSITVPQMEIAHAEIKSSFEPSSCPFEFIVKGNWKDPLEVQGKGNWQKRGLGIFLDVDDLGGYAFSKPFMLCAPFSIEWGTDHFRMSNFALDIAQGHIDSQIDLGKNASSIKLKAEEFPLEFITLPMKHFSLEGLGAVDLDLVSYGNNIQGNCNATLKRAIFRTEGATDFLTTKGSLQVHLNGERAQVHGELKARGGQFFNFFGSIPILYKHFPFQVTVPKDKPISGELMAEGKLEDLLNFINIGSHRLEGLVSGKVYLANTLDNPTLQGDIEMENGLYENYYTGTLLQNISAKAIANQKEITITELAAKDQQNGTVTAKGSIMISPEDLFPFTLTAQLKELSTVTFDTISGAFSGKMTISGNQQGATAQGKLKVEKATFRIPDQLPSILPDLPITFVNPPESIQRKKIAAPPVAPLLLDLDINVPKKAYVEGRGIHAELKGKLHLTGTYTDMVAKGTLQLITGEYIFSGKVFNLSQGELIFYDKPTPSSYISLTGTCDLPEVDVTLLLRGPLTSPKLTFQSSPQLPTSSLLAQILFNKDVSEISAIQALQLAQTVISLSGSSTPDILEKIRKTLGIDRLTIVTSENDPGKISLQIGKYLMRGVMLTLSQGAESRNVTVEVDLKRGITLQAEVNEDQQGKLSLKWHHHY